MHPTMYNRFLKPDAGRDADRPGCIIGMALVALIVPWGIGVWWIIGHAMGVR